MRDEDKFEVDRSEYEVGKVTSQFFLPETYPVTIISALATGYVEKLNITLNPKLPYHKIWLPVNPIALTNLWGNITLFQNKTPIFKVPWLAIQSGSGFRFSIPTRESGATFGSSQDLLQFGSFDMWSSFRVFSVADEAKVSVEESAGVGSYTIGFAIQSSVANF